MEKQRYSLKEVKNRKDVKDFLALPEMINQGDRNWIRPLDEDIEKIFNRKQNKHFRNGDAIRWLLLDGENRPAGRIAAFYNMDSAKKNDFPTGGCGFFECVDDQEAANILFDAAREWLTDKGMEAMDGPINFGPRDHFWGCLSEGFYEPVFNMPYNPAYYNRLFVSYGFKNYFNQYTYHVPLRSGAMDEVIYKNGEHLRKDPHFNFECIDKKQVRKYAEDFVTIFNAAWARFPGVKAMRIQQAMQMFNKLKPLTDERAIIFGYHNSEPIAFFIMIPDLFEIIKKFNGKFGWIQKLRMYYYLKFRRINQRLIGLIFGVVPEYQGKGVAAGLILRFEEEVAKPNFKYTDLEMNWIGDFNPQMMKLVGQIGGKIRKTHITYRYIFDRNVPFKRAKKIS
jgi:GNAT superfamily N-acetyltransferase